MPVKVVDASAVSALLFGEPEAGRVAKATQGFRLAAPTLLDYEVSSVCLKKLRVHPGHREALLTAHRLLPRLPVDRYRVDAEDSILLAEETGLSVYDAAYLWLMRTLGVELITLDRRLASVAKQISQ